MTLEEKRQDVIARNWLNNWTLNEKDKAVIEEYLQTIRDKKTHGSAAVTGTGTAFTTDLEAGDCRQL